MRITHYYYNGLSQWGIAVFRWGNIAIDLGQHLIVINWEREP